MKPIEFTKHFPDEASCRLAFKQYREREGVKCKKCGNTTHYWKSKREQWECKKCNHRTTLKSGTVMQNSKLPFSYWFIAMHLITSTKKTFSAKEVQRQIGHKRYEPIWSMMHKLRLVMGMRDDEYQLSDEVELDDSFFKTVDVNRDKTKPLKRERGSQQQTKVLVSVESQDAKDKHNPKKHSKKKKVRFIKMKVINSLGMGETTQLVEQMVDKGTNIKSDKSNSYNGLKKIMKLNHK